MRRLIEQPARDADHSFVDEAFVAGIHALVDLVDDAEGGASQGLQGHEVEDCADGAFAAGLAVRVEGCQGFRFSVVEGRVLVVCQRFGFKLSIEEERWTLPEFDANLYSPLVEVFVFVDANFAGTADLFHVLGERVTDLSNEGIELWLPSISKLFDLVVEFGEGVLDLLKPGGQGINLLLPLFILPNHTPVTLMHKLQPRSLTFYLALKLLCCLLCARLKESFEFLISLFEELLAYRNDSPCCVMFFLGLSDQYIDLSLLVFEELFYRAITLSEDFKVRSCFYEHDLGFVETIVRYPDRIYCVLYCLSELFLYWSRWRRTA